MKSYDVIVIGGGHAGIEAANASALLGSRTAMLTLRLDAIGRMSCNPAIGGVAKGQLVRDIDALGGLMGKVADETGIQFRMLNQSKGPAVWGPRGQMDMDRYALRMQEILTTIPGLDLVEGELVDLRRVENGFELETGESLKLFCKALIITSGTFLGAIMHTGMTTAEGGRVGEGSAMRLAASLKGMGLKLRRLKTGTPARLHRDSIDYGALEEQEGDPNPIPFSFRTTVPLKNTAVCWITRTSAETHSILREGFDRSPMFTGKIQGLGPRYCPSVEDKVARFPERDSHQLFLEPEGLNNPRIYVNGFSSSLPADVQDRALRTLPGLKHCEVIRYGYAVEYDALDATTLHPTLEHREHPGLYFAGQVNGTSGYEEAAGQGWMAGVNAALKVQGKDPFLLTRAESYLGVMVDDLIRFELAEPYRLFTSRAEFRLQLRQDNAEERLLEKGYQLGLIDASLKNRFDAWQADLQNKRQFLTSHKLFGPEINAYLQNLGSSALPEPQSALALLRRPEVTLEHLLGLLGQDLSQWSVRDKIVIEAGEKYRGFAERQSREIDRINKSAHARIPVDFDFLGATVLSMEARQKLHGLRPLTVGQAQGISGVTPADISVLLFLLAKGQPKEKKEKKAEKAEKAEKADGN